jgi:hypothetical protein
VIIGPGRQTSAALLLLLLLAAFHGRGAMAQTDSELRSRYRSPQMVVYEGQEKKKIQLGKTLFFDPILSGTSSTSCATCHQPGLSWGNGLARAIGDDSNVMMLRVPTLIDIYQLSRLGWNGKFPNIEAVTFAAITSPANMNLPESDALARIARTPGYAQAFDERFPGSLATIRPSTQAHSKVSYCSTERRAVRRVMEAGHLRTAHSMTSAPQKGMMLDVAHCSPHRVNSVTPLRPPRSATWRIVPPTCMTDRFLICGVYCYYTTLAGSSDQVGRS